MDDEDIELMKREFGLSDKHELASDRICQHLLVGREIPSLQFFQQYYISSSISSYPLDQLETLTKLLSAHQYSECCAYIDVCIQQIDPQQWKPPPHPHWSSFSLDLLHNRLDIVLHALWAIDCCASNSPIKAIPQVATVMRLWEVPALSEVKQMLEMLPIVLSCGPGTSHPYFQPAFKEKCIQDIYSSFLAVCQLPLRSPFIADLPSIPMCE